MDFISNREQQWQQMLAAIGISSFDELLEAIPSDLILPKPLEDDGLSEYEGLSLMQQLAAKNSFGAMDNYLGAGAYEHHIPALVAAICSKSEFLTAYTPYQAEASQGILQAIFEYQSAICALTEMDVANASVYDGASACAEALLMALRLQKGRRRIIIANSVHPHYREVINQYLEGHIDLIEEIPYLPSSGEIDGKAFCKMLNSDVAAVLLQSPNFFGIVEDIAPLASLTKRSGALTLLAANPLSYGLYSSAATLGADIAIGDSQPLGLPLSFGGPYAGYMACRTPYLRQLPGRLVGATADLDGKRGFVLTLQAREQHIRREKATSNICTNQALAAMATLITLLWCGKNGLSSLARANFQRARYLQAELANVNIELWGSTAIFNEFVVHFDLPQESVEEHFYSENIAPGIHLGTYYPELEGKWLITVTETKNKNQLDRYAAVAKSLKK